MFEFEIGSRKFALHKSLVSRLSPALSALMENGMRESQDRFASIPDVDEATFARFAEYLYTGDYNTLQPVRSQETLETIRGFETANCEDNIHALEAREAPAEPEPAPLYEESDSWGALKLSAKDKKRRRERECAIAIRHNRSSSKLPGLVLDVSVVPPFPTSSLIGRHDNTDQTDYTAVFFCHAKLYVLAEKYGVEHLKKLSSDRLSKSFIHYEHATKPSANIPGLLRYVFNHTPERQGSDIEGQTSEGLTDSRTDILQDICVRFAANNTDALVLSPAFHRLLRDGGSFVEMYIDYVARRLARVL